MEALRDNATRWMVYAASLLAGMVLWEVLGSRVSATFLEPLTTTLARGIEITVSGQLPRALVSSLILFGTGLAAAIVVGVPVGLLTARIHFLRVGAEGYITALYATPMVALVPFIMAIFGLWFTPKAIIVFLFAVFPIVINVFEGARSVDPKLLEVARSFRSSERQIWRDVILPYTLPFTMTGIRLAIARGLVGVIVAEFFLAASGLGELILRFARAFDTAGVFSVILVVCLLGVSLMALGQWLENRFAAWREI